MQKYKQKINRFFLSKNNYFQVCCPSKGYRMSETLIALTPTIPYYSGFTFISLSGHLPSSEPPPLVISAVPTHPTPIPSFTTVYPTISVYPTDLTNPTYIGECGISVASTTRLVGGIETIKGKYPWLTALGYKTPSIRFLCSGSLITNKHVLTSAHCITNNLSFVRLGAHNLSTVEPGSLDVSISQSISHEEFDLKSTMNDIAIIVLDKSVRFTDRISTICLPTEPDLQQDFIGYSPFVAGWGAVQYQGPTSNVLQEIQVPVVSLAQCMESYKKVYKTIKFNDRFICAGNGLNDACQGDSGGPLMFPRVSSIVFMFII